MIKHRVMINTNDDFHAITPNDLLLQRSKNVVPGPEFDENESLTRRQQFMVELEECWWNQWIIQVLPFLVPFKKWRVEHRSLRVGDIVLVQYQKKLGKGEYRLARVTKVHPDHNNVVRTVTVGMRRRNTREPALPYIPGPLVEMELGVQRLAVISPVEEQENGDSGTD